MFFNFTSNYDEYEETMLPIVWEVEKAIQSLIMADRRVFFDMDVAGASDALIKLLRANMPLPEHIEDRLKTDWIIEYLRRELPCIRVFVSELMKRRKLNEHINPREDGLLPNAHFKKCIQENRSFRTYITHDTINGA